MPNNVSSARDTSVQKRIVVVLMLSQVLGGLGVGAALTIGTSLITHISGNPAISGLAATMGTLGAAAAGIPLAKLAMRRGRRFALSSGNLLAVAGAGIVVLGAFSETLWIVLVGLALMGTGQAAQLQSRFAATDLSVPEHRGRDLSLVVWSITIGAVIGPNLIAPGEVVGAALNMPVFTGAFIITGTAQLMATLVIIVFLRPDPLLTAQAQQHDLELEQAAVHLKNNTQAEAPVNPARNKSQQRAAIAVIAIAQAVMVAIMAMTPAHLTGHGYSISVVGLTISLHIAGMFALAPVFGLLVDKIGARQVVILGIAQLLAATVCTGFGADNALVIQIGLILLGTGWSAVTVSGSALLTSSTPQAFRTMRQGQSDTFMSLAGAGAGALAGVLFGFGGFPALSSVAALLAVAILLVTLVMFTTNRAVSAE